MLTILTIKISKYNIVISQETIIEFQDALKEEYNRVVTLQEASLILNDLVSYFDLLAKIDARKNDVISNTSDIIKV